MRLPAPGGQFVGRDELLDQIGDLLGAAASTPQTIVLHGLGGVGKTSLALAYGRRHLGSHDLVWFLSAEDLTALRVQFAELAALLGVRELVDTADAVQQVHAALASRPGPWLLIFDNVASPDDLRFMLPPAGNGSVVTTSRYPHWPTAHAIEVPVLSPDVATSFLAHRAGITEADALADVSALASELGYLPLALEQAGAFLDATDTRPATYLHSLIDRATRGELFARGKPDGYAHTVATTWAITWNELNVATPAAIPLLRLLAHFAPESIPYRLLLSGDGLPPETSELLSVLHATPLAIDDAITALRRFSLTSPPRDGTVSVHRLVQTVTRDQLDDDVRGAWQRAAADLVQMALPANSRARDTWQTYATLLPHAVTVLTPDAPGMAAIIDYLQATGDYATASALQRRIYDHLVRRLGPDHPTTLGAHANLAYFTGQAGDVAGGRDMYSALLPVWEELTGPADPDVLIGRANFAYFTGLIEDPAAARDLYAALLPIREQVSGPEHPDTLLLRANLANFTGMAGDPGSARDMFAALLPLQQALGNDDSNTLMVRLGLAFFTGVAGDATAARDLYAEAVPIQERLLGPNHFRTLSARGNLARWTGEAGDPTGARDLYASLLPIMETALGVEHPITIAARAGLTRWTAQAT